MQYLKKKGMTRADGEEFLQGQELPEYEWKLPNRGRRGSAASDTSSEGGRGKFTPRFLPLDSYKGVSPSNKDDAHNGKNGKILRVYKYIDGSVRKITPVNWTDEANKKFSEMYGGDGGNEGFEKSKKKGTHANDVALEQMDEMRAMLEKLTAERDAATAALAAKEVPETKEETKEEVKVVKKFKADKAKKKAEKLVKKKADALKKQQEELKRQQEEIQKQMAAEMEEESDSDFDSDEEEEIEFNSYEYKDKVYHHDEDTNELMTYPEGDYFGYIDDEGEVHEGDKDE
jgi:hypothetical protein